MKALISYLAAVAFAGILLASLPACAPLEAQSPLQPAGSTAETAVQPSTMPTTQPSSTPSAAPSATPLPSQSVPTATNPPAPTLSQPSPTPLALLNVPIEGGDPENHFYAMLVFPQYTPAATQSLWFRVYAHKPTSSKVDGDGIENVAFTINNSQDQTVHYRLEKQAGYCAFGGGEPDCVVWDFATHNYTWPDGGKIESGKYTITIVATSKDQTVMFGSAEFRIQVP